MALLRDHRGDSAALGELYADDAVVWHNTDGIEMTKEENLASLDALAAMTTTRSFSNIRRYEIDGGFVQQHVMHLDWGSGLESPACSDQGRERQNHQGRRVLRWSDHRHIGR